MHGRNGARTEENVRKAIAVEVAIVGGLLGGFASSTWGQKPPLLPERDVAVLANELSGETAKRNLEVIATFHRQRGSKGFHAAAELVASRLREYGLGDVQILQFAADGKSFYGTQRSRPAWDAEVGELTEVSETRPPCPDEAEKAHAEGKAGTSVGCHNERMLASYAAEPVVLAEDSESAEVTAELVDVGIGTKDSDYVGKDVKAKIVLASAQPGEVQDLAIGKFGAAGIVSYAQNQKTAWWGEDESLIRWGHLETFSANKTFAFMISLKTARGFHERLAQGENITLHAVVKAGQHSGNYEVVTATIPGADAKLKEEEIAFSCHLDHQRPGANDNASGCVTILEVARTLHTLISEGKLAWPARTIRFIFPPEIEGTVTLLNAQPGLAKRIKAVVHMDMVGGGAATKAVFHVTRGPMSLPSFVHDVAWAFADFVNEESYQYAATGTADYPMVAPEGGKEPLRAEYAAYTMGSDHDVYQDSSFGIPAIYLNDWPDRYIHTNFDTAANIDPTKLKRAAFIGAASGYFLTRNSDMRFAMKARVWQGRATREAQDRARVADLVYFREQCEYLRQHLWFEQAIETTADVLPSTGEMLPFDAEAFTPPKYEDRYQEFFCTAAYPAAQQGGKSPDDSLKFRRSENPKGPLAVFGYDYFADHAKAAVIGEPKLLSYKGLWGNGEEYGYEVLNFADGKRNLEEIRNAVAAEYGPVPLEMVAEWLRALEKIGVVSEVQ